MQKLFKYLMFEAFTWPLKFGPVFWSRLFWRSPVEYNYPFRIAHVKVQRYTEEEEQQQGVTLDSPTKR